MLTFKQFLAEADDLISLDDFLKKNCGPFLHEVGGLEVAKEKEHMLYRGLKEHGLTDPVRILDDEEDAEGGRNFTVGYLKNVRSDRTPKDTPREISEIIDDYLEKKFGWRPRTMSAFCFGWKNRGGTTDYGTKHAIYPMGEMQFVYSPHVRDLTYQLSIYLRENDLWYGSFKDLPDDKREALTTAINEFMDRQHYTNENLIGAMEGSGRSEIMVRCKQYLAMPTGWYD